MDYRWCGYAAACGAGKAEQKGLELLVRLSRGYLPQGAERVRLAQLKEAQKKEDPSSGSGDWREIGPQLEREREQRAEPKGWSEVQAPYRIWLYSKGASKADVDRIRKKMRDRKGFDEVEVLAEFERMGEVPIARMLRQRVKTFTRGAAIGGDAFLGQLMAQHRACFGEDRKVPGRKLPGKAWLGLEALRVTSAE